MVLFLRDSLGMGMMVLLKQGRVVECGLEGGGNSGSFQELNPSQRGEVNIDMTLKQGPLLILSMDMCLKDHPGSTCPISNTVVLEQRLPSMLPLLYAIVLSDGSFTRTKRLCQVFFYRDIDMIRQY
jgi:hypothetical protein